MTEEEIIKRLKELEMVVYMLWCHTWIKNKTHSQYILEWATKIR